MPKQVIGRVVKPPTGWTFEEGTGFLMLAQGSSFSAETFDTLYSWAKDKKYGLEPQLGRETYAQGQYVYCTYKVLTDSWDVTEKWLGDGKWLVGATRYSLGRVEVIRGGAAYINVCANCSRAGLKPSRVGPRGMQNSLCPNCCEPCARCETGAVNPNALVAGENTDACWECVPRTRCNFCRYYHPTEDCSPTQNKRMICKTCAEQYGCDECGEYSTARRTHEGRKLCPTCLGKARDAERAKHEEFTDEELPVGGSLMLASLPNRPVRCISIETEVDGDPVALANTLYNAGYVREALVEGYSTKCPDKSSWPAFLKYDGSVTGGELINYLLNLDVPEHADSLKAVLGKLRSLEKTKQIAYHENCGGHIHIDAHNFSTDNVWRLVTAYNYLEDVIFRLAGAGHKFGHRTLVEGHDRANHGRGYSHPTAKGPWGIKSGVTRALASQDRMTGLNFVPYFSAVNYCACGAGAENLRSCKCTLPKCTIEWRVWNSQGNPRILHGWLAFMQALHAWADTPKEMTPTEENEYPPLGWTKLAWKNTTETHQVNALDRVRWIFKNLVFSEAEKDSLTYAFKQTDIEFPDGFWDEVGEYPTPKNRTVKRPRNCSIRQKELKATPPETPYFGNAKGDPEYIAQRNLRQARERMAIR